MTVAYIEDIARYDGQEVTLRGWLYNRTPKGKLQFLVVRDGTGMMQAVAYRPEVGEEVWARCESLTQESSSSSPAWCARTPAPLGGYEMSLKNLEVVQVAEEYPITLKEHGTAFLMEHRHLWLRSTRQHAILKIRAEIIRATPRLPRRQRLHAGRRAHPHARRLRGHEHALRDRLFRARRPT